MNLTIRLLGRELVHISNNAIAASAPNTDATSNDFGFISTGMSPSLELSHQQYLPEEAD